MQWRRHKKMVTEFKRKFAFQNKRHVRQIILYIVMLPKYHRETVKANYTSETMKTHSYIFGVSLL